VIVASGGPASSFAAKAATAIIPIVFVSGTDPVKSGLVTSLNRPGGNMTGVTFFAATLAAKRLDLLHELVPGASKIAVLVNPSNPNSEPQLAELHDAARIIGLSLAVLKASSEDEIDAAFATLGEASARALVVAGDTFFNSRRDRLVKLALCNPCHLRIPRVLSGWRVDQLRKPAGGSILSSRRLRGPHPRWRQTCRPPGGATDNVRAGRQSQDREGARPQHPAYDPRPRRRSHRMNDLKVIHFDVAVRQWDVWKRRVLAVRHKVGEGRQSTQCRP